MANPTQLNALNQRVWYVEGGVHPLRIPQFLSQGKVSSDPTKKIGEAKRISAPDPNNFDNDIQVGTVQGETTRATLSIATRYNTAKSILLDWTNRGCRVDIFILSGKCGNPQDFSEGGEKWTYFQDGRISGHAFENFGAFGKDENNPTNDSVDMTSADYMEYFYMRQDAIGATSTVREIYTVDVYPGDNCDDCPNPCSNVLMSMKGASATPGTPPAILYSVDGGETFAQQTIDTLFSNEDIVDSAIIGGEIVLVSNTARELHYTNIELLYDGTNIWAQNGNGFVAGKSPRAIWSVDVRRTWVVGDGGYIYFVQNHKALISVQDSGVTTSQNLLDVHAFDKNNVIAVGASNAVVRTYNGGASWESVTGPSVGVSLSSCWMWSDTIWFVGEGAGGTGKLWLTVNSGKTWTQVILPGNYGRIYRIEFASDAEGYIVAATGGLSVVLRTKSAGSEWLVLPDGRRAVAQANSYLSDIATCSKYANTVFAAGLASNGSAGIAYRYS